MKQQRRIRKVLSALVASALVGLGLVAGTQPAAASTYRLELPVSSTEWQGYDVDIAPNGSFALATTWSGHKVYKIDTATMTVLGSFDLNGSALVQISPDSSFALITTGAGSVHKFDTTTLAPSGGFTTLTGIEIGGLDISSDGSFGVVTDQRGNVITFSTATGAQIENVGGMGYRNFGVGIAPDGTYALVAVEGTGIKKVVLDGGGDGPVTTIATGYSAYYVDFNSSGTFAYVSTDRGVVRVDNTTTGGSTTHTVTAPFTSRGRDVVIAPDGSYAYLIADTRVHRIDTATDSVTSSIDFSGSPSLFFGDIAPSGTYAYIADMRYADIYRIPMAPSAPTITSVSPGNQSLSVNYTAGGDGGSTITNYEYSIDGGTSWVTPTPSSTTSPISITGLTNGTAYSVKIRGVNAQGSGTESSASASVTPRTTPGAPTISQLTPGDGSIIVDFTAPSIDGGSAVTSYEYSADGGSVWQSLGATSPATISSLTNGTEYSLQVRAVNAAGGGAGSNVMSTTPRTAPSAPTGLVATPGNRAASVSFSAGFDGGSPITNYQYSLDNGVTWSTISPADTTSPITIPGLSNGQTYAIALRARNVVGPGATSSSVTVTPAAPPANSSGSSSSQRPVTSPSPSPSPTPSAAGGAAPAAVTVPAPVAVGEGLVVVDGRIAKVNVQATEQRTWKITGEDFTLEFIPKVPVGELEGSFTAKAGTEVDIAGDGFVPGSLVATYLPGALAASLGDARVQADGTFTVTSTLPNTLEAGQYVFQVNGLASPTSVRSVNLGMQLLPADTQASVRSISRHVFFKKRSATASAKAKARFITLVDSHTNDMTRVVIVPTVSEGAGVQARRLARARANALKSLLTNSYEDVPVRVLKKVRTESDPKAMNRVRVVIRLD